MAGRTATACAAAGRGRCSWPWSCSDRRWRPATSSATTWSGCPTWPSAPDFLGLGSGLPRAVPSDAVVAVLDELVPGMLLQKLVLLGIADRGGGGCGGAGTRAGIPARCVAASVYVWNPFVVERLVIGHWPVLAAYAAMPWLVVAARRHRARGSTCPPPCGSSCRSPASARAPGIATALVVLASVWCGGRATPERVGALAVAAANAPWVVAGLLHAGAATSDPAGASGVRRAGKGLLPGPLAALGLGGIWNSEVVPATREGVLAVLLLVATALPGRRWAAVMAGRLDPPRPGRARRVLGRRLGPGRARAGPRPTPPAGSPRTFPEVVAARRFAAARPVRAAAGRARGPWRRPPGPSARRPRPGRAPWPACSRSCRSRSCPTPGGAAPAGSARSTTPRRTTRAARAWSADADGADVVLLPFSSFRAPEWNDGRKVLDPLGRYLEPDFVGQRRAARVRARGRGGGPPGRRGPARARADHRPARRGRDLARLGIGIVAVDARTPGGARRGRRRRAR